MKISSIIILILSAISIISCKSEETSASIEQENQEVITEQLIESKTNEVVENQAIDTTSVETEETIKEDIKKAAEEVVNRKRAKLVFNEKEYNYGMINQGDEVQHDFIFTNTGDADLVIKSADATCGCTTPEYPFLPIKPGKTGKIGVKFNSTGKLGPQKPMVTLVTNASPRVHRIYLNGFVNSGPKETPELIEEEIEMEIDGNTSKGEVEIDN